MTSKWEKTAKAKKHRLIPRHRKLIDYFFGEANFYKTRALRMAGYAHPEKYTRLFDHPAIAEEIERRHRELRERQAITYENVSEEMAKVAFANLIDFGRIDPETGDFLVDLSQVDATQMAAIGEISVETYVDHYETNEDGEKEPVRVKRVRIKTNNKIAALEGLMRHGGLSKDNSGEAMADLAQRLLAGRRRVAKEEEEK